ncbi:MAG TPA: hypothetical protein VGK24_02190 [Candidatus Angelobacter sp.]|jgi:hypothetical protein
MRTLLHSAFAGLAALMLASPVLEIQLQHNDEDREQKTKVQMEKILKEYDLSKWTFTRKIVIAARVIPHSHPILTLSTRHLDSDDLLLSTYVHEQLHWWLDANPDREKNAENALRKMYSQVPVGNPDGADSEESTYMHLVDCYLEMQADRALMGRQRADKVMEFWAGDHYRWIYKTVISDEPKIAEIVRKNHLEVK